MNPKSKGIVRFLTATDDVVKAYTLSSGASANLHVIKAVDTYTRCNNDVNKEVARMGSGADSGQVAGCAKAWLDAYQAIPVVPRIELLFKAAHDGAAAAASTGSSRAARRIGVMTVVYCGQAACALLHHGCNAADQLANVGSSPQHRATVTQAQDALLQPSLMSAAANAARAVLATSQLLLSETAVQQLYGSTGLEECELADACDKTHELAGITAVTTCQYLLTLAGALFRRLFDLGVGSGSLARSFRLPPDIAQALDALADSQLLASCAGALVDSPPVYSITNLAQRVQDRTCYSIRTACVPVCKAILCWQLMQEELAKVGGPAGKRVSGGLLRAMRHVAVRRLQVALLDQLAAHAGMGAQLQEAGGGGSCTQVPSGGLEGNGQQQQWQQGDGWEGSSGTWWLAREEANRRQLLGMDQLREDGSRMGSRRMCERTAGWLEDYHSHIVRATVVDWYGVEKQQAAAAGVPTGPPPLLAARLAARAAEALCRLCCRQGLGGAYAPAPLWQLARAPALVLSLLPKMEHADALPPATARSCLPYWLEAAGWAAALMSDATAAAMGRLPATEREANVCTLMDITLVRDSSEASTLDQLWTRLRYLAASAAYGLETLPAATQDDVRRRLFRCGLAASLDHTLRLAYSAQDSDRSDVASDLYQVLSPAVRILTLRLAPLLPPTPQAGQATVDEAGAGSSCNDRKVGGGEVCASREQLGLLYTLSKRAAMLTRALEVQGQDGGQRQSVPEWAGHGLALLTSAMNNMNEGVRQRLWAASQAAAASGGEEVGLRGGGGASTDGACVDEAHEALAMAARAACNLAAAYAWQLAADVGAVSLAGGSAASMPLSLQEERVGPLVVSDVLHHLIEWGRAPLLLSPMQLLACQPHRLLAAACALVAALPAEHTRKQKLGASVLNAVVALSAHPTLRGRVRSWLAPPPTAAAGTSNSGGGGDGSEGCLAVPVELAVRHMNSLAPRQAALGATLLKVAAGEVRAGEGAAGGGDPAAEADGGYRPFAEPMAQLVRLSLTDPRESECLLPRLPDGARAWDHAHGQLHADGRPLPPPPSAPSGPLPPPLALPLGRAGALPRLYICGNPRCSNFGCEGEWALPLKHCGGCRAVRYCGADCQRAHWREGHRAECKALGAGM